METIPPGAVRSDIETVGIDWVPWIGRRVAAGTAVLEIAAPRDPCAKMDVVCPGLRERMLGDRQGVLARVVRSGIIHVGDAIRALPAEESPT